MLSDNVNDPTEGGNTSIVEKVIEKVPDNNVKVSEVPKVEPKVKQRKPYTKRAGVTYGNPNLKKAHKLIKKETKSDKVIENKNVKVLKEKIPQIAPNKNWFYVGLAIGGIIGAIGLYRLIKWLTEKKQSDKEIKALKEIANSNDQFLEDRQP